MCALSNGAKQKFPTRKEVCQEFSKKRAEMSENEKKLDIEL